MIWLNGQLCSDDLARVSIYDGLVRQGDGIFDMTRSFGGWPFRLGDHVARFNRGCRWAGINHGYSEDDLISAYSQVQAFFERAGATEHRGLFQAGRGPVLPAYREHKSFLHGPDEPWVMISMVPLQGIVGPQAHLYDGVECELFAAPIVYPGYKHNSRGHFAHLERQVPPGTWVALRDFRSDSVLEATGANILLVDRGVLLYGAGGCLPGISRAFVVELARRIGLEVVEYHTAVSADEVDNADEVFFTCTPLSIVPCKRLGENREWDEWPITEKLTQAWIDAVGCDFRAQARSWA